MKVRRVFWNHHQITKKKVDKCQSDYDASWSHERAAQEIHKTNGRPPMEAGRASFEDFAEIISSIVTENERIIEDAFHAPKHFGTDCLISPQEWSGMQDTSKVKKSSRPAKVV